MSILLRCYQTLSTRLFPLFFHQYIQGRLSQDKELAERLSERQGYATLERPKGPLVWIHGASVGESLSVLTLISHIQQAFPNINVLMTTGTVTSAQILKDKLPPQVMHQFIPFDSPPWIERFLIYWRPQIVLWVESEVWPNLLMDIHRRKIPLILVNGRMSTRSYRRWSKIPSFIQPVLESFDLCLVQSKEQKQRFEKLGAKNLSVTPNLKFSNPPLSYHPPHLDLLTQQIGDRPFWLAVSTHPGEEILIAKAHDRVREIYPHILTILIPRHPHRGLEIAHLLAPRKSARRSQNQILEKEIEIYISDTLGELGLFYRLASPVFIGKSLCIGGGHNPLEPAQLGCTILHGPRMENFSEIITLFQTHNASLQIHTWQELAETLLNLFQNLSVQEAFQKKARTIMTSHGTAVEQIFTALRPFFHQVHQKDAAQTKSA